MNAPSTPGSSKAPETNGVGATGFRPQGPMVVQPPRQEDLQKSYASIVGNDADAKGWYGSMSKSTAAQCHSSPPPQRLLISAVPASQHPRLLHGNPGRDPVLHLLPQPV